MHAEATKKRAKNLTTKQEVERIIEIVADLDAKAVGQEVKLLTSARIKSAKLDGTPGVKATESPALLPDKVDRWVRRKADLYSGNIAKALKLLEDALFAQSELLVRLHDGDGNPTDEALRLAAEAVSPQADSCANCKRAVERTATDKLLGGRCRACWDYLKRTGGERPQELWATSTSDLRAA